MLPVLVTCFSLSSFIKSSSYMAKSIQLKRSDSDQGPLRSNEVIEEEDSRTIDPSFVSAYFERCAKEGVSFANVQVLKKELFPAEESKAPGTSTSKDDSNKALLEFLQGKDLLKLDIDTFDPQPYIHSEPKVVALSLFGDGGSHESYKKYVFSK